MHRSNNLKTGQAGVNHLIEHQRFRNHADHFPSQRQSRISNRTHQANLSTAVNQSDAPGGKQRAQFSCSSREHAGVATS